MNSSLIRHLGVALLGHYNLKNHNHPDSLRPVFRVYRDDEHLLPNLLQNTKLRDYLSEFELIIPDTSVGCASLIALAIAFGHVSPAENIPVLFTPKEQDALWNKLKTRLKIRREKEIL